ncbi:MAG: hypothetical protein DLM68_15005 [Hyphomicrobiales bacterium]|nr:MAG: hypothetical protein DLM68_15005 [Hyphomicrobiales bacterium]
MSARVPGSARGIAAEPQAVRIQYQKGRVYRPCLACSGEMAPGPEYVAPQDHSTWFFVWRFR